MAIYLSNRDGNGKTSEEGHYRLQTRILRGVVLKTNDLKVSQTSPLSLAVKVGTGDYRIDTPEGYAYTGWLTADEVLSINAPDSANPRISSVVIYVDKLAPTNSTMVNNPGVTKIVVIDGAPSSTPIAPTVSAIQTSVGGTNPFAILATVRVNANATNVTDSNITDTRVRISLIDEILEGANIKGIVGPLMYPVGSLYTNTSDGTNPATLLGFGTWSAYATGQVPVGIDTSQVEFTPIGTTGGAKTHTLTTGQVPSHSHTNASGNLGIMYIGSGGEMGVAAGNTWTPSDRASLNASIRNNRTTTVGGDLPHNNLQPYVVVYMWRRTA